MDKIESFLTNAARELGGLFEAPAAAAKATPSPAAVATDAVDPAATDGDESTGVLRDDYQRFDTSGDRRLDDQLLLARTGGPAAAANASKPGGPPQMTATGQYDGGDHNGFVLKFDRPVSRAEAEKVLFKEGKTPEPLPPMTSGPTEIHDNRVLLGASGKMKDGKASEWTLLLPKDSWTANYKALNDGVEAKILDAPTAPLPAWIPPGTRGVIGAHEIPRPGDSRFSEVHTGYPAPNDQVTTWRDGHTTFRYDGKTGRLDGVADRPGADMKGYNDLRNMFILDDGMSIDAATRETASRTHQHLAEAIFDFVLEGYLQRDAE
jgi:hypothetical protein